MRAAGHLRIRARPAGSFTPGSAVGRTAYLRGVAYFLCTLVHGPSWDDARGIREQDGWEDHAAFMDRLVEEGLIIIGGPVGTGEHTAHLIESEDAGEIRARLAEDPWAKDNHLMVGALDPWALWLDGRQHEA